MEGDNFVSLVVPPNGVTVSLFAGALVPSTAPSSNSIPRPSICPEVQTVNQICLHGTRRENHSASAPITTKPPGRSRVREPPTSRRRRSRSKLKSRSRSRSRKHRASCSPDAGKTRHDSKSPKRDRRSCSVTSTCSRNIRRESPNERSPVRPLSGERQRRRREWKKSPDRHYSRKYISMATSIDVPIENHNTVAQEEHNSVSSETDLANALKENPNDAASNKFDAIKWVKFVENEHTVSKKNPVALPKVNLTLDNAKYQNFDENTEIKQVSKGVAVNYVTGLQTYVKSFYSDTLDCSGYDACPPLRDRMAHHRLRHHSGYKIDPRVNAMDNPVKDNLLRNPTSPTRDHLVQTKVTLGDLGEIVIRLDKGVKVSNENGDEEPNYARHNTLVGNKGLKVSNENDDEDPNYARRNTLVANKGVKVSDENDYEEPNYARRNTLGTNKYIPPSKNGLVDIDYKRNRISKLERPDNNIYGTDNTNGNRGMNSAQRRSSKRRSTISKKIMPSERDEDKSNYNNYENQEEGASYNDNTGYFKTGDKRNRDRLDTNTYRDKLTVPNDQNEYDSDIGNYGNDSKMLDPNNSRENRKPQATKDENGFNDIQSSSPANDRNGMKNNNTNDNYYRNRRQSKQNRSKDSPTHSKYRDDISGNNVINDLNDDENDINSNTFEHDDITPLVNNTIYLGKDPSTALSEEVKQWLHFVPLFPDTIDKDTIINDLMEKLNKLSYIPMDVEERDKILEKVISDCLDKLHTWYPGAKRDQADYKHNLIKSLLQRIAPVLNQTAHGSRNVKQDTKPVFNQATHGSRNKHQQEEMQKDPNGQYEMQRDTDGQNNDIENDTEPDEANLPGYKISKRNDPSGHRHKSKKKYKTAYKSGHLVRSTISSNVVCGDTGVKKTSVKKPTEKYKSEFAQAIYNWITRYDFLKHDGLQQISIHDLIGILLSRLSPYLDRPYNSTNKLILKAKIVDIMNSLPICIHHSPYQKTQVIKFAEELANSLLNIQTRFEDDKKYAKNLFEPQYHLLHIEEVRKKDLLRTQISNELRQCLQNTPLSDDILVQIRLTEIVLNYFETFQKGYTDVTKSAVMSALEEATLVDNYKTIILDKIIKSLYALSENRTVDYKMPSIYPESGLSVKKSEMEIRDTVFSLFTQTQAQVQTQRTRNKKGSGLSVEEDQHLENLKRVIRDWTVTLPEPFSKLRRNQKEDFISGLAEDVFVQEKIQNIAPIPYIQRDKFWKFFAYRWFYRISLFEDLNSAEPYSVDLCNRLNEVSLEKTMSPLDNHTGPRYDGVDTDNLYNNETRRNKWEEEKRRREEDIINMQRQREEENMKRDEDRIRIREDRSRKQDDRNNYYLRRDEVAQETNAFGKDENSQMNNVNKRCELCNKQKVMLWEENSASERTNPPDNYFYRTKYTAKITAAHSEVMNVNENARELQLSPPTSVNALRPTPFIASVLPTQTVSQPLITKAEIALSPKSTLISNPSLLGLGSSTTLPEAQTVKTMCPQNKLQCLSFATSEPPNSIQPIECLTETENCYHSNQKPNENKINQASVIMKVNTRNKDEHRQSIIENLKESPHPPLSANNDKDDWIQKCPCIWNKNILGIEKSSGLSNGDRYDQARTPFDLQNKHEIQAPEDLVSKNERSTNKPSVNACSISNTQEFVNQMYQVVDMCVYDQDGHSPSHAPLDQRSNAYPKIKSTQLNHEISIMKEFIKKYLEYKNDMNDPIIRVTFFYLLKNELQQTGCKRINKPLTPENLEEELKYMKLISEWLKQIPVDEAFNTSMNKDRIYFVKGLAQNIARIDINKIRAPYAMDYDKYLERVIKRYAIQLPLLPEQEDNIRAVIEQLFHVIKSQPQRKAYPDDNSLHGICISEQNKIESLDKHIRQNGEQLQNDELVLDAWAHRLVEEVLQSVSERSSNVTQTWQVLNFSVGPSAPNYGYPTYRFRLELDYAKEIVEFLNSVPVPSSPIDVEKIHELTEKLIFSNKSMVENLNDGCDDQEVMNLLERWMMDLPLNFDKKSNLVNAIQKLAERINRVTKKYVDTIKTETISNNSCDTRIPTESSMMHCRKNTEKQSSECQMAHLIENWCQCLPIDGPKKENIKVMKAHVAKILFKKIYDLKANTKIYNDDSLYKHFLENAINTQFDGLPVNAQLKFYNDYLKTILVNKLMALKTRTPEKRTGHAYRKALEKALEEVVPSTLSEHRDVSFEIYIHQLTNKFLIEHFDHSKHPAKLKYCRKIQHRINKHVQSAIQRTGRLFTPDETNNLFYNVLFKVPVPDNKALKHQIEYIKTRCEIDNWIDTLPLKKTADPSEFDKWDHSLMSLAKKVVNFEQEPTSNIKLHKEILRHLARFPLEREYEFRQSDIAYRLLTLLATTLEARQCITLEDLAVKDSSQTIAPQPCLNNSVPLSADRRPTEVIETIIENWCRSLPLKGFTEIENQSIKENLTKQLTNKINHLNDSGVDSDRLYEKYLNEEIEKAVAMLHSKTELHKSIIERKQALKMDIMYQRPLLKIEALRKEYRLELSKVIESILSKPDNLTADKQNILEVIQDEIMDNFMEYNYNKEIDEIKNNHKKKLVKYVFDYVDVVKNKEETIPLETQAVKANRLITEMSKIAEPNNFAMKEEIQEVRMKNKLDELFNTFLPKAIGMELASRKKAKATLAKQLHDIEKTGYNSENITKMKEEISKAINAIGSNLTQETINEFINNLEQHLITRNSPLPGSFYLHETNNNIMNCTQEPSKTSSYCGPEISSSSGGYPGWNPDSESLSESSYAQSHNTAKDISHDDQSEIHRMISENFYGRSRSFPRHSGPSRDNNCDRTPSSNESETSSFQQRNPTCREKFNHLPLQDTATSVGEKDFTQTAEGKSDSGQGHETLAPMAYHQENVAHVQAFWSRESPDSANNASSTKQAQVCTQTLNCAQQTSLVVNSEKCCGHPQQKDQVTVYKLQQDVNAPNSVNSLLLSALNQTDQITTQTDPAVVNPCVCRQFPSPQMDVEGQQLRSLVPTQKAQNAPLAVGAQQLPFGAYIDRYGVMAYGVPQPGALQNIDNRYDKFPVQQTQGVTSQRMPIAGPNVVQQLPAAFAGGQSLYRNLQQQQPRYTSRCAQIAPGVNKQSVLQTPEMWNRRNFPAPVIQFSSGQTQQQSLALPLESARRVQAPLQWTRQVPQAHVPNPVFYQAPGVLQTGATTAELHKAVPGNAYTHGQFAHVPNAYKRSAPMVAHLEPPPVPAPLTAPQSPQYCSPKQPQQPVTQCYYQPTDQQSSKSLHFNHHQPVGLSSDDKTGTQSQALQHRSDQSHSPYRQPKPEKSFSSNQPSPPPELSHQRHPQSQHGYENLQAQMKPVAQSQQCSILKVVAYPSPKPSQDSSSIHTGGIQYDNYPQQSPERSSAIPSPQESEHMKIDPSKENGSFIGSPQRSLMNTQERAGSVSHAQNITNSAQQQPTASGQQNLYQMTQAKSFFVQVNQSEHTQHIPEGVQTFNVKPEIVNAGCSNIEAHIFQRVATSTTTISGNRNPEAKIDDGTDCGSQIRDQSTQGLCNQGVYPYGVQQGPIPYWQPCNPADQHGGVKAIPVPAYNSYHLGSKAVCDKYYSRQHSKCCAIPVLQYCDSVEDFLPTLLPMNWFKVRSRKKRQPSLYADRL